MTNLDAHDVYVSAHEYAGNCGPVLRCATCPDWEVDVDGTSLAEAVKRAAGHERSDDPMFEYKIGDQVEVGGIVFTKIGDYPFPTDAPDLIGPSRATTCCDFHNRNCEPPSELCCDQCTEAAHDTFPTRHADGSTCVLATQPPEVSS